MNPIKFFNLHVDPFHGVALGARGLFVGVIDRCGYERVHVKRDGRATPERLHRVVWEVINGPIPPGMQINHKNGIKTDNRIENLELVTASQNIRHSFERLGKQAPKGEKHGSAKLTEELVELIRRTPISVSSNALSRKLGVNPSTIRYVRRGDTWTHTLPDTEEIKA